MFTLIWFAKCLNSSENKTPFLNAIKVGEITLQIFSGRLDEALFYGKN